MTEKELSTIITEKLGQGATKSTLYDQFQDEVNDESLRKILASFPSYAYRQKFKKMHLILSIIWGLFILLELIGIFDLMISFDLKYAISLVLSIYITINIWRFDGRFFLPGIIWFIFSIFNSFGELDSIHEYDSDYGVVFMITSVYSLVLGFGIYIMYHIRKNVFSYFNWFQPMSNQDDEIQFE